MPPHYLPLKWSCGCGQVELEMSDAPYFCFDCHCSACTPVARYLDAKSDGQGISPIVHETGVAKAFFLLDKVQFIKGKDKIAGDRARRRSVADHRWAVRGRVAGVGARDRDGGGRDGGAKDGEDFQGGGEVRGWHAHPWPQAVALCLQTDPTMACSEALGHGCPPSAAPTATP